MTASQNEKGATGIHVKNGKPAGYTAITPFIVVDNPAEAIAFCEKVFGAKAQSVTAMNVGGERMIVHADLDFGDGYLQLGAANPAYRLVLPPGDGNACYSLGVYVPAYTHLRAHETRHDPVCRLLLENKNATALRTSPAPLRPRYPLTLSLIHLS